MSPRCRISKVGVVDPAGLLVLGVHSESVKGFTQPRIGWFHDGEDSSGRGVRIVHEEAPVVGRNTPLGVALADRVKGLLQVAPDVPRTFVEVPPALFGGDDHVESLAKRMVSIAG